MIMSNHSDKVMQGKRAFWVRWIIALFVMGMIAALSIVGVGMVRQTGQDALFVADPAPMKKVVSSTSVTVPANIVIGREQRIATVLPKLRVAMLWPDLEGYSETNSNSFLAANNDRLIFVTLNKKGLQGDTNDTLERVYLSLFEGAPRDGPAGLKLQDLKAGIGYDGEFIALHTDDNSVWAARCQTPERVNPVCLRDISINDDLMMQVEFSTQLLRHWQALENSLKAKAATWLAR